MIMASEEILKGMLEKHGNDEAVKKEIAGMNKSFQFKPTDGKPYCIRVAEGRASLVQGEVPEANVTISASEETLTGLFTGSIDPVMSYMTGKIKISGDMMSAMKITGLVKNFRK
jgi:putative sterol carrier protein